MSFRSSVWVYLGVMFHISPFFLMDSDTMSVHGFHGVHGKAAGAQNLEGRWDLVRTVRPEPESVLRLVGDRPTIKTQDDIGRMNDSKRRFRVPYTIDKAKY